MQSALMKWGPLIVRGLRLRAGLELQFQKWIVSDISLGLFPYLPNWASPT